MKTRNQLICLGAGYGFFVLYLLGLVVVAGFIPPPAPDWGDAFVAAYFHSRHLRILAGMSICAVASALYVPWGVVIAGQMLRIEKGRFPALTVVQGISAGIGSAFFAISPFLWLTIAFRAGHSGDIMVALNDFAWISWIVSWPFFFIQAGAFALSLLMYPTVVIPRWVGYLSLWFAFSMFPASAIVFFHHGPLAWNGVFAFYLPLALFALWYNVTAFWVLRAIRHESRTIGTEGDGSPAHQQGQSDFTMHTATHA
jgi:MFS family permease